MDQGYPQRFKLWAAADLGAAHSEQPGNLSKAPEVRHILREQGLEKQEGEGLCVLWTSRAAWFWGDGGLKAKQC